MRATGICFAGVLVTLTAACSQAGAPANRTTPHAARVMPGPPAQACVFPTASSDFGDLLAGSTLVVQADVQGPPTVMQSSAAAPSTEYVLANVTQFADKGQKPSSTVIVDEAGGVPVPLLPPSHYVLFLGVIPGSSHYTVVNGMLGAFPVTDNHVARNCPNYNDASNRRAATGSGVALSAFEALVRNAQPTPQQTKSGAPAS